MKKIIPLLLALTVLLCACAKPAPADTNTAVPSESAVKTDTASDTDTAPGTDTQTASGVKIDDLKVMGDVQKYQSIIEFTSYATDVLVYGLKIDGIYYRASLRLSAAQAEQAGTLDLSTDEGWESLYALVADCPIGKIENLSDVIPSQETLNGYVGKTGQDLLDEGWDPVDYDLNVMQFRMNYELFAYTVEFNGSLEGGEDFDMQAAIAPLTVKSVTFCELGSASELQYSGNVILNNEN